MPPKFASFKHPEKKPEPPKEAAPSSSSRSDGVATQKRDYEVSRSRSRIEASEQRNELKFASHVSSLTDVTSISNLKPDPSRPFVVDTRGDRQNVVYGSAYDRETPNFRRAGSGQVMGINKSMRIDWKSRDDKELLVTADSSTGEHRMRDAAYPKLPPESRVQTLSQLPRGEIDEEELDSDYISIGLERASLDEDDRSLVGAWASSGVTTQDHTEHIDSAPSEQAQTELDLLNRRAELSKLTKLYPADVSHWLALAEIQGQIVRLGKKSLNRDEERGIGEVRIAIYEKALKVSSLSVDQRNSLSRRLMAEVSRTYEGSAQQRKWREILSEGSMSLELWVCYLDFMQTQRGVFNYNDMRDRFSEAKSLISTDARKVKSRSEDDEAMETYRIVRLTCMMRAAGYAEHAYGLWQALLELNFLSGDSQDVAADFQAFWESEKARIGEVAAHNGRSGQLSTWSARPMLDTVSARSRTGSQLPARVADEGIEDMYSIVLIDDVINDLTMFSYHLSKIRLVNAFLAFSGFGPLNDASDSFTAMLLLDPFLRNQDSRNGVTRTGLNEANHWLAFPFPCVAPEYGSLIQLGGLDIGFLFSYNDPPSSEVRQFVRRVLEALLQIKFGPDIVATYLLSFDISYFTDEATKTAKRLLKHFNTSLSLYATYALFERRKGGTDKSDAIFQAAAGLVKELAEDDVKHAALLYRLWTWELIVERKFDEALQVLQDGWTSICSRPEYSEVGQQGHSAVYKPYELGREYMLRKNELSCALDFQICLAYLEYLSPTTSNTQLSLDTALKAFAHGSNLLSNRQLSTSATHERFLQCQAQLIYTHTTFKTAYQPKTIQRALATSLSLFPNNTIFLSLTRWIESKLTLNDRLRSSLSRSLATDAESQSIIRSLFAIFIDSPPQLASPTSTSATTDAIQGIFNPNPLRSTFRRLTSPSNPSSRYSSTIWKQYYLFELAQAQVEAQSNTHYKSNYNDNEEYSHKRKKGQDGKRFEDARNVLLEGIRCCPWDKGLILLLSVSPIEPGPGLVGDGMEVGGRESDVKKGISVFSVEEVETLREAAFDRGLRL